MSLIYLASPYTHPDIKIREARYKEVLDVMIKLIEDSIIVYSPIVHCHEITVALAEDKYVWEFWKRYNMKFLSRCDELWVLTTQGWRLSVGVKAEIDFAETLSMPIRYYGKNDIKSRIHLRRG